ncbi:MAG: 3-dehydroquinate synthase [Brumimicrobium sp.]|nr:3-dehydroquinate synthase [Brumimicrobium sp.]
MTQTIPDKQNIIQFGPLSESDFGSLIDKKYGDSKKIILVDENTHDFCLPALITSYEALNDAEIILLPVGEGNKVMEVCFQVWEAFSNYGIQRKDLIINLGGGVVTDMGGFIASVYKRGLNFINIPTSLLAMVDASVGGKTGINLGSYKNQLGVFSFPVKTYCDPGFLQTLPEKEWLSGKAEMLKHALIADSMHWDELKSIAVNKVNSAMIRRSVEIKMDIVEQDPEEKGLRKTLNLGHTVGHALEGLFMEDGVLTHGECVAWGMVAEAQIANNLGMLGESDLSEIDRVIRSLYEEIELSEGDLKSLIRLMKNDKKNEGEKINFSLPEKIGRVAVNIEVDEGQIIDALKRVFKLSY